MADPEVGTLGGLDIQCRPNAKQKKKKKEKKKRKKNDHEFFMGSRMFVFFAGLSHAMLYVRAHMHILSIMMGDRGDWMVWISSKKNREMLL